MIWKLFTLWNVTNKELLVNISNVACVRFIKKSGFQDEISDNTNFPYKFIWHQVTVFVTALF